MNDRIIKKSALAMALALLLSSCAACSSDSGSGDAPAATDAQTAAADETAAETEPEDPTGRANVKDTMPADLDFGGRTYKILVPNGLDIRKYYAGDENLNGEVINDAALARNLAVEERLNIKLEQEMRDDISAAGYKDFVRPLLLSGDTAYDLYEGYQWQLVTMAAEGGFINHYDLDHIDFSQPWWWNDYMNELTMNENVRLFSVGDYSLLALSFARAVYYNKEIYKNYYGDGDALYQTVLDGKWTIDAMKKIAEDSYVDLNGNSEVDTEDQLGLVNYLISSSVDPFVYGTDIDFCKRLDDGSIELDMLQDKAATLLEKINALFWLKGTYNDCQNNDELASMFSSGRVMFMGSGMLFSFDSIRDMQNDFGIIPYPKYDETQQNYRTLVHDAALLSAVNGSSQNIDMAGAVMESLCVESYRTLVPAYYETALKVKYTRDSQSAQMLDLMHDTMYTSFIYAYNYSLNGIGLIYRDLVSKQADNYVSNVEKKISGAQKQLDKLYDMFSEMSL